MSGFFGPAEACMFSCHWKVINGWHFEITMTWPFVFRHQRNATGLMWLQVENKKWRKYSYQHIAFKMVAARNLSTISPWSLIPLFQDRKISRELHADAFLSVRHWADLDPRHGTEKLFICASLRSLFSCPAKGVWINFLSVELSSTPDTKKLVASALTGSLFLGSAVGASRGASAKGASLTN